MFLMLAFSIHNLVSFSGKRVPPRANLPSTTACASDTTTRATSSSTSDGSHSGGMGYGIVHQQHIPADESENLFRHVASPKTVSVIG